MSLIRQKIKN